MEGPSKAEITCKDNKDGTCTVSYLPTAPGDYSIIVRFDDKHIPGSPFTAKITGEVDIQARAACHTHAPVSSPRTFGQRLPGRKRTFEINARMLFSTAGKERPAIPCFKRLDHLCQLT